MSDMGAVGMMSTVEMFIYLLAGDVIGATIAYLSNKYYKLRFGESLLGKKRDFVMTVLMVILSGSAFLLFRLYGYDMVQSVSFDILLSGLVMIGLIDKKQMVIPTAMVRILFAIGTVSLAGEILIYGTPFVDTLATAFLGVILATFIFVLIRAFRKSSVGMGDIRLLAVVGLYLGSGSVMLALLLIVIFALIYGVIQMSQKTLSKKDEMSFAPFIAAGTIFVMLLGI